MANLQALRDWRRSTGRDPETGGRQPRRLSDLDLILDALMIAADFDGRRDRGAKYLRLAAELEEARCARKP